jgi:hypothetical protein
MDARKKETLHNRRRKICKIEEKPCDRSKKLCTIEERTLLNTASILYLEQYNSEIQEIYSAY